MHVFRLRLALTSSQPGTAGCCTVHAGGVSGFSSTPGQSWYWYQFLLEAWWILVCKLLLLASRMSYSSSGLQALPVKPTEVKNIYPCALPHAYPECSIQRGGNVQYIPTTCCNWMILDLVHAWFLACPKQLMETLICFPLLDP